MVPPGPAASLIYLHVLSLARENETRPATVLCHRVTCRTSGLYEWELNYIYFDL